MPGSSFPPIARSVSAVLKIVSHWHESRHVQSRFVCCCRNVSRVGIVIITFRSASSRPASAVHHAPCPADRDGHPGADVTDVSFFFDPRAVGSSDKFTPFNMATDGRRFLPKSKGYPSVLNNSVGGRVVPLFFFFSVCCLLTRQGRRARKRLRPSERQSSRRLACSIKQRFVISASFFRFFVFSIAFPTGDHAIDSCDLL